MNTADTTENTEKKTSALPAKKVSDSETHQLHVVIHPDINGFGRLFGGRLLEWIDEVAGATARRHCGRDATTVAIDKVQFTRDYTGERSDRRCAARQIFHVIFKLSLVAAMVVSIKSTTRRLSSKDTLSHVSR